MATLHHHPLCPGSRFARLVLAELGIHPVLIEERPWERRAGFLKIEPAGATPVFIDDDGSIVPGAGIIAEYLNETKETPIGATRLLPQNPKERLETRRLLGWFLGKFDAEVTDYLVREKIYKRFMTAKDGGGAPDMVAIRAARSNVRYHLKYIGWLVAKRGFLAGEALTYADFAAAAHLSCVDYLGDVPWSEDETARDWYERIKARPSFKRLLNDRVPGLAPSMTSAERVA